MMKRIIVVLFAILLLFSASVTASAEETDVAQLPQPIIVVTDYKVSGDTLTAGTSGEISVTLTNKNAKADAKNLKITFSDSSGDILPSKINSVFVPTLSKKASYTWTFDVVISKEAAAGSRSATITTQYESSSGEACSSSDSITLSITSAVKAEPQDKSQPRLMVTGYTVDNDSISPDSSASVHITIKNTNTAKAVSNLKLSIYEESGEIRADGMSTEYITNIGAGGSYVWNVPLTVLHTAKTGEHKLTVTMEYEDSEASYTASDTILLGVRQSVSLEYSGALLPAKVIQGDTTTMSIVLMNTGRSTLYNCMVSFDIKSLTSGGSVLAGTIESGESKSANTNLRIDAAAFGDIDGNITITYEDEYGESYKETVPVSTVVEEKAEAVVSDETKESQNTLWWLFVLIGAVVGAGAGLGISFAINSRSKRIEDEKRL